MKDRVVCPICNKKLIERSELQDKICNMITIKQFASNCPDFDVQYRPFFEKEEEDVRDCVKIGRMAKSI